MLNFQKKDTALAKAIFVIVLAWQFIATLNIFSELGFLLFLDFQI